MTEDSCEKLVMVFLSSLGAHRDGKPTCSGWEQGVYTPALQMRTLRLMEPTMSDFWTSVSP